MKHLPAIDKSSSSEPFIFHQFFAKHFWAFMLWAALIIASVCEECAHFITSQSVGRLWLHTLTSYFEHQLLQLPILICLQSNSESKSMLGISKIYNIVVAVRHSCRVTLNNLDISPHTVNKIMRQSRFVVHAGCSPPNKSVCISQHTI